MITAKGQSIASRLFISVRAIVYCAYLMLSILVLNLIQLLSLVTRPFSRTLFRKINTECARFWWASCVFISEKLLGVEAIFTGACLPAKENAIVVANHQQMPDTVALMMLAQRKERLGDLKWFVKNPLKYVPGIGWACCFWIVFL